MIHPQDGSGIHHPMQWHDLTGGGNMIKPDQYKLRKRSITSKEHSQKVIAPNGFNHTHGKDSQCEALCHIRLVVKVSSLVRKLHDA